MPDGMEALKSKLVLNAVKFKHMGMITFDDNEKSDYKARELKSIHI